MAQLELSACLTALSNVDQLPTDACRLATRDIADPAARGVLSKAQPDYTGDLTLAKDSSYWFGAVVRGDVAPITIGSRVNVQDNAVVHCDTDVPNEIEDDVTIGHSAVVHGEHVGFGSLVGMIMKSGKGLNAKLVQEQLKKKLG